MRSEVGDAANGIALDLDVLGGHLSDQGSEAAKSDNGNLVFSCRKSGQILAGMAVHIYVLFTARLPRAALAALWTSMSEL